ncbi:Site-specific recombinase XerD [Micromonospora pallida]|uniref:Site-specific recombinase XerD n=1 Tax=Micromonospora pallida TaxID=145854 RepID=A0A1C6RHD7_9ACTN|nr:site-specific integrase [Micromonospora pallida]SCL16513.1 Site-specific recombinase XerD [Micromonospora pallida]SCL16999.1 Site-specific recombinase XerD [Micromonospora pallida]SCL43355.1 Site-specific recombinase XerD [Micromonospora pallida]
MASIERRGDSWRVVWRYDGQKQYTSWPAEEYANEAKSIVEGHRGRITADRVYTDMGIPTGDSNSPADDGITLKQWCEEWLPSKTRISPGTRERYEQQLRDRIYPAFGDTPLPQLTSVAIGTWLNELRASGMSQKTVTRYYSLLHTALTAAMRHGHISVNPCHGTDFIRDQRADDDTGEHHAVYLTPQQFELLRAQFAKQWHSLLDCIVETGLRWSEVTALAAMHLVPATDSSGPRLRVWRAWKEASGKRYLGTTKGRAKRVLPIGDDLYRTLTKLVEGQPPETLIFRDDKGALDYDRMYDQAWKPALLRARLCPTHPPTGEGERLEGARGRCRDYGGTTWAGQPCGARVVDDTTRCAAHYGPRVGSVSDCDCPTVLHSAPSWHDLRHTYASWLFSDPRMTPLAISRLLGHQQLATTSEIYGDLMPQAIDAAVDAVADARKSARPD